MSLADKAKNVAQKVEGEIKEKVGQAEDNPRLEAEGKGDKVAGSLKNAGENVKDAIKG
jgi:uncharacterized protein YjbJ (UPF0337 family)